MTTSGVLTPVTLVGDSTAMECGGDACLLGFGVPHRLPDSELAD